MKRIFLTLFMAVAAAITGAAQGQDHDMKDCPMHEKHASEHHSSRNQDANHEMNMRGDQGMGFAQDKTTHHFLLRKDGGAIQVLANSAGDKTSIAQIQQHFQHISQAFQSGDFNIPMFVHDQTPPGVSVMIKLKDQIRYRYEQTETGARVVISSENADAIEAVHQFLRFQIKEHKTGDSLEEK